MLEQVGGAEGVGVTFLEETFSAPSADAKCRQHQQAARAVLERAFARGRERHPRPGPAGKRPADGLRL